MCVLTCYPPARVCADVLVQPYSVILYPSKGNNFCNANAHTALLSWPFVTQITYVELCAMFSVPCLFLRTYSAALYNEIGM